MITQDEMAAIGEVFQAIGTDSYGGQWADQWLKTKSLTEYEIQLGCGLSVIARFSDKTCCFPKGMRIVQWKSGQTISNVQDIQMRINPDIKEGYPGRWEAIFRLKNSMSICTLVGGGII